MSQNVSKLTARQRKVIAYLAQGHSIEETAQICKVSRATIHRWKASPTFARTLEHTIHELVTAHILAGLQTKTIEEKLDKLTSEIEENIHKLPPQSSIWALLQYWRALCEMHAQRRNLALTVLQKRSELSVTDTSPRATLDEAAVREIVEKVLGVTYEK